MPLIDVLTKEYYSSGFKPKTAAARAWFVDTLKQYKVTPSSILRGEQSSPITMVGNMFFFRYDAKLKDKLPYWDAFPLVIPMEFYGDSFLGLNLHYMGYEARARFLDRLVTVRSNPYLNEDGKIRLSYQILKESKKFREVQPCIKKYLYSHVKSQFVKVEQKEWEVAIFLPVQKFIGAPAEDVWDGTA